MSIAAAQTVLRSRTTVELEDRFVRALPADPNAANAVREVRDAAYSLVTPAISCSSARRASGGGARTPGSGCQAIRYRRAALAGDGEPRCAAVLAEPAFDWPDVVRCADAALCQAKRLGRHRVFQLPVVAMPECARRPRAT